MRYSLIAIFYFILSLSLHASYRSLSFEKNLLASRVGTSTKEIKGKKETVYVDGLGREVLLRGWNISDAVKLKSMGLKPFKNVRGAKMTFRQLKERTGTNVIRYTILWEGVHPEVDKIDYNYLKDTVLFIKETI